MKLKLTPELSYVIGLWRKARCMEGIGVRGSKEVLEIFVKEALDKELATSDKILTEEDKVYFYHSAYRKFFQEVEKEQLERFKYLNEYAANYLAGMFDAVGSIDDKGVVSLGNTNKQDEMMLLRLGFQTRRRAERLVIERPVLFLTFIKNYVKVFKDHKVFSLIKTRPQKAD
ncbi:MAG: LAGLIDADG family homing endonuclease [Candidatus Micrarchaeota archaeon]